MVKSLRVRRAEQPLKLLRFRGHRTIWVRGEDLFHQSVDAPLGHTQATNPPSFRQQQLIVSFEGCTTALTPGPCANIALGEGLFTGQAIDTAAGNLYQALSR